VLFALKIRVPLRLRRALQSRVEAPLFRKPCMKMRVFFDLGGWKTQAHANVPLRLHRALQSRFRHHHLSPCRNARAFLISANQSQIFNQIRFFQKLFW